nr:MAG TPA: lipolytic protein [Caudoviricetes sp.]
MILAYFCTFYIICILLSNVDNLHPTPRGVQLYKLIENIQRI